MHYLATLDGVDHEIEVEELESGSCRLQLAGQEFTLDLRKVGANSYSVLLGERVFDFEIRREGDQMLLASRDGTSRLTLVDQAHRRRLGEGARGGAGGRSELKAMMPGRVVALLVAVGDEVAADQGVITVEAMKMENELRAPRAGKIVEVKVAAGQAVEKGEILVVIE